MQSGELVRKFEQSIKPCVDIAVLFIYLFSMFSFRRAYLSQRDHSFSSGYVLNRVDMSNRPGPTKPGEHA